MSTPKVSIVVPCYNQAQYLDEALQSILNQTYSNWECIIVNDGSPDNTEEIARYWLDKDARFKYLYKDNGGLSSARNAGITIALGEFILPLDSDDFFESTFIEKAVEILESKQNIGAVTCYCNVFKNKNETFFEYTPSGGGLDDFMYQNNSTASALFRKICWIEAGGYDEKMKKGYEDWEFWISITSAGWNISVIEEFLFNYRKKDVSMLVSTRNFYEEEIYKYVLNKHKKLYILDFEKTIDFLQKSTLKFKKNELKRLSSLDYRLGNAFLKPLRFLKKIISK